MRKEVIFLFFAYLSGSVAFGLEFLPFRRGVFTYLLTEVQFCVCKVFFLHHLGDAVANDFISASRSVLYNELLPPP